MPTLLFQPEDYRFPTSIDEVLTALAEQGDKARVIAGGTTVHELAYRRAMGDVRTLLDVTRLPLRQIAEADGTMHVGATVTFTELADYISAHHQPTLAIIADAIAGIRPMQIRNVGTVGGSICSSLPFFDLPAALVALDARITTHSVARAARTIPIEDFFQDFFLPDLRFGEFLTEAEFALPGRNSSGAFQKFESNSVDWALVSIGAQVSVDAGRFTAVRIALGGGIGRRVTRARTVENALLGAPVDDRTIEQAVLHVADDVRAFSDFRGSAKFRNHLLKVYVARCLKQAARRIR
ncbi:FAD binding domain-containing protein [Mycobacterium sp. 21AC1]|uniref:FAD binding domain-containing protein n=1 Tax=[Mycobacterium] appelbergii TaxID=2939269 RepID=UPI0029390E6B|nr:FAD binding domain-containing protein [Mycobacterium sp. 21AC1]MDV3128388.1 FAD binding domain-containing protein [Mycobacterium sp. 21AC1]